MSNRSDAPKPPRPYAFVPFARPRLEETVGHDQVRRQSQGYVTGEMRYQLHALTPVFVASGVYALGEDVGYDEEPLVRSCYRVHGVVAIPGSSIKGVVRSVVEAVSPSCVSVTRLESHLIPFQPDRRDECKPERACPACSIFGRMSRMSKVFLSDALLVQGHTRLFHLRALHAPRPKEASAIYRTKEGQYKGRKFYYHARPSEDPRQPTVEAIDAGSLVEGSLGLENLTEAELGLLFFALGLDGSFALKVGGGKPAGLGSMRIEGGRLSVRTDAHFLQADAAVRVYEGDELSAYIGATMQQALRGQLILKGQAVALRRILREDNLQRRQAPTESY